jgi:hypothetical protein
MWRGFFTTKRRARWSHRIIGGGGGGFGGLGGGGFGGLKYMRLIPLPNHEPLALLVIQIVKFWTASAHTTGRALNKKVNGHFNCSTQPKTSGSVRTPGKNRCGKSRAALLKERDERSNHSGRPVCDRLAALVWCVFFDKFETGIEQADPAPAPPSACAAPQIETTRWPRPRPPPSRWTA